MVPAAGGLRKMMENPYQSFWDWVLGRFTCPECGTTWKGASLFDDMTLVTMEGSEVVEESVECSKCGFSRKLKEKRR